MVHMIYEGSRWVVSLWDIRELVRASILHAHLKNITLFDCSAKVQSKLLRSGGIGGNTSNGSVTARNVVYK